MTLDNENLISSYLSPDRWLLCANSEEICSRHPMEIRFTRMGR